MRRLSVVIVLGWLGIAAAAAWYTAVHIDVNTDTAGMISSDLPFRRAYEQYRRTFPLQTDSLVVVIDGQTPEQAERAAIELGAALRARRDLYSDVDVPGTGRFFDENGFLYLSEDELADLSSRLVEAQPFLGLIQRDPSLRGFAATLSQVLTAPATGSLAGLEPVLREFARVAEAELGGTSYQVSWQKMLAGESPKITLGRRFVLARPILAEGDIFAAARPIDTIRSTAAGLGLTARQGVRLRITGDAALSYEEMQSALAGARLSTGLAFVMVAILLAYGLRSVALTLASLATLVVGLLATAGFATLAVGRLNLISLAFSVLYIGLAVDYAINYCLRYRECLASQPDPAAALRAATRLVGPPLAMCALSTCIGFYAFLPTAFSGVAELGLISGTGMIINLVVTLTFLPALLLLVPAPSAAPKSVLLPAWYRSFPYRYARPICWTAGVLAIAGLAMLPRLGFDRNPLNLRDSASESVATIRELMTDHDHPVMSITVLAPDEATAGRQAQALRSLPEVGEVVRAADFVPDATPAKLAALDELSLLLGPQLEPAQAGPPPAPADSRQALETLREDLRRFAESRGDADGRAAAALAGALDRLLRSLAAEDATATSNHLKSLEHRLLDTLPVNLERLRLALQPKAASEITLPAEIRSRWIAADGMQRLSVYPRESIESNDSLRRFVEAVARVAPDATDEPVLNLRAGDTIVGAFRQALALAAAGILVVVLALMRSVSGALLVTVPLILSSILTGATMVLLGVPFNFANVMALPLLLGIGVDFGILIVQRMLQDPSTLRDPLATSTARAVLFSGLATTCGIGNLAFSPHPGTSSMGLVLSVGLAWSVLCTLVVLPALFALRGVQSGR